MGCYALLSGKHLPTFQRTAHLQGKAFQKITLTLKMMALIYYTYSSACFAKAYHFIQENRKLEISLLHFLIFCSCHVELCSGEIII